MKPGSESVVVIYEELSMLSAIVAWEAEGASLIAENSVSCAVRASSPTPNSTPRRR